MATARSGGRSDDTDGVDSSGDGALSDRRPRDSAAELLGAYLSEQYDAIRSGEAPLREGLDAIHPTRVATRRLRSLLRVFVDLFAPDAVKAMDNDLSWYAALLGAIRERQVLRSRFAAAAEEQPPDDGIRGGLAAVDARLLAEEKQHWAALMRALDGSRYAAMVGKLDHWTIAPPFVVDRGAEADLLAHYVRAAARTADKRLATSTAHRDDADALHRARKAAKRARYSAEMAREVLGEKAAKKAIDRYKAVQEALGEHQDSVDAITLLRGLRVEAGTRDEQLAAAYHYLLVREQTAASRALSDAVDLSG